MAEVTTAPPRRGFGSAVDVPAAGPAVDSPIDTPIDLPIDPGAFVRVDADGTAMLHLLVENVHCANCIARIENALGKMPGVIEARVNLTTRRLTLRWDPARAQAGGLVEKLAALGYPAVPYNPETLGAGDNAEARFLLRCLAVAGFAAANVMLLSVSVWAGAFSDMGPATRDFFHWLSALIALPAIAYAGRPFFGSAVRALAARSLNMDVPISLAVLLTAGMSLFETATGGAHAYFDAAITLLFFLLIGRTLDRGARARAREAAERLLLLAARAARVIGEDGVARDLPIDRVRAGMTVVVAPGEAIPADGRVLLGVSQLDTGLVTGEALPRPVAQGDTVYAGTVNIDAPLRLTVTAAGEDTLLSEMVRLMEAVAQGGARYVRLADRAARLYVPVVHGLAAAAFIAWWAIGGLDWQPALLIAVSVLIVTCPCALGLAVPAVQIVAGGRLMKSGILLKTPDGLERLAATDTIVFDKTGTLTLGRLDLANRDGIAAEDLSLAASLAAASRHPLCRALVREADGVVPARGVSETPGQGLECNIHGGGTIRLGSRDWCGITDADPAADPDAGPDIGPATGPELWLAQPGHAPVRFDFRDALRPDAIETVARLKADGYAVELLSGDRPEVVRDIAGAVGIDTWRAQQKPADKLARLNALAAEGHKVTMVGDGLNDAPAMAAAFASISPATGADISQTAADVVFQGASLSAVVRTLHVARKAKRLVLQNFGLAFAYNAVAVPLAIAGWVTPLIAAAAMSASSLVVTVNALRLRGEIGAPRLRDEVGAPRLAPGRRRREEPGS